MTINFPRKRNLFLLLFTVFCDPDKVNFTKNFNVVFCILIAYSKKFEWFLWFTEKTLSLVFELIFLFIFSMLMVFMSLLCINLMRKMLHFFPLELFELKFLKIHVLSYPWLIMLRFSNMPNIFKNVVFQI